MSVNSNFGGQSFIGNTYSKVKKLKAMVTRKGAKTIIEIDGGVTNKNAKQLVEADADVLEAGSFVLMLKILFKPLLIKKNNLFLKLKQF